MAYININKSWLLNEISRLRRTASKAASQATVDAYWLRVTTDVRTMNANVNTLKNKIETLVQFLNKLDTDLTAKE